MGLCSQSPYLERLLSRLRDSGGQRDQSDHVVPQIGRRGWVIPQLRQGPRRWKLAAFFRLGFCIESQGFLSVKPDKRSLEALLAKSAVFKKDRCVVVDASQANKADAAPDDSTFLVCFTDTTKAAPFVDDMIDKAITRKVGGVHVKAHSKAIIPSKITAYRMRSITWRELEAIFK